MEFSLSAAAKATGKGKSTIHNAIKTGRLSAKREEGGSYKIDASELARVFKLNVPMNVQVDDLEPFREPQGTEAAVLQVKVAMLEDQLARERETSRDTIDDLRKRLDRSEERVHALTYQAQHERPKPTSLLSRILGR
jgi:hypothetical protein